MNACVVRLERVVPSGFLYRLARCCGSSSTGNVLWLSPESLVRTGLNVVSTCVVVDCFVFGLVGRLEELELN
jgi:hypothetical protein